LVGICWLLITRLSGNAARALAFVEVLTAAFERGFFPYWHFRITPELWADHPMLGDNP
jgi:hypothetical protein